MKAIPISDWTVKGLLKIKRKHRNRQQKEKIKRNKAKIFAFDANCYR